ncbi:MAG: flippase-like domain-containing protein [Deltaproteobacteria bacterium]|nr:flippase-like domain-containing protein [Deltaproteobacteria bacterium]
MAVVVASGTPVATAVAWLPVASRYRKSHIFNVVALVIGAIALTILLYRLGWSGLSRVLTQVGPWFAVIAVIDLASVACDAFGIHGFLRAQLPQRVSYWRVFAAQISGVAINRLSPANSLGEPVKMTMLSEHVPPASAISAVVMFNIGTVYLGILVIVIGVPLTLLTIDLPPRVELAVWIGTGVLLLVAVLLVFAIRRGPISTLLAIGIRLRLVSDTRAVRWRPTVTQIDTNIRSLGNPRSGRARGIAGVLGSRCFNWLGTVVLLYASDFPLSASLVIASLTVGVLITWTSNIIPLGLGISDSGNYALYGALGAGASAGLDFAMVNRARTCVLAMMGLTVMSIAQAVNRRALARAEVIPPG